MKTNLFIIVGSTLILIVGCGGGGDGGGNSPVSSDKPAPEIVAPPDQDQDGIPDATDDDIDGDGLPNDIELTQGTNPAKSDTDDDGVNDDVDNCPVTENSQQEDADKNGIGDACTADDDGDGLSDDDEINLYKTNPLKADSDGDGWIDPLEVLTKGTNPNDVDTDGDGIADPDDVFPLNAAVAKDIDGDGVGDKLDNCPEVENPDQSNLDQTYAAKGVLTPSGGMVISDDQGDACDDDIDGDGIIATFVSAKRGRDDAPGTFFEPVKSLARALVLAHKNGDSIIVAVGSYSTAGIEWPARTFISGGYSDDFAAQTVHNPDLNQQTILTVDQEGRVVDLLGIDILSLQGVTIKAANVSSTDDQVINVEEAKLILKDCELLANLTASTNTGIRVGNAGELVMERTRLQMHSTGSTRKRTALLLEGGNSRLANDIILVDGADYLIGLDHRSGSVLLSHLSMLVGSDNAIEAAGVSLRDGAANIVNSLILTAGAQDQAPLECRGESMIGVRVVNNLLSSFGGQDPQPLLVDCRGNYFMPSDLRNVNLTISDGEVRDTIISSASVISEVVDLNTWQLIGPDGVDAADLSADQAEGVIDDFASTLRPPLNDIGAFGGI